MTAVSSHPPTRILSLCTDLIWVQSRIQNRWSQWALFLQGYDLENPPPPPLWDGGQSVHSKDRGVYQPLLAWVQCASQAVVTFSPFLPAPSVLVSAVPEVMIENTFVLRWCFLCVFPP